MVRAIAIVIALSLGGCADAELEKILAKERADAAARAYAERQATIAQACEHVINICPASMTAAGRAAIAKGASGGGPLFWLLVTLKVMAILVPAAAATGAAAGASGWIWARLSQPALDDLQTARKTISQAQQTAQRAAADAQAWAQQAEAAKAEALAAASAKAEAEAQLESLRLEIERLQSAKSLLTGL